ncbi:MAG: hypothetical protein ACREOB_00315 [Thermodesulfobacteriota bacterium]
MRKHPNITDGEEVEWVEQSRGEKFGFRRKSLSSATGGISSVVAYMKFRLAREPGPITIT